jgi:hypothetical protein
MDTNTNNLMLNAFMEMVNNYIDRRVAVALNSMNILPADCVTEKDVQRLIDARLSETTTNTQIMATLDAQLEAKMREIAQAVIHTHEQDVDHPTNDDIRDVVDETDLSSNLESAIQTYLDDHDYAKEEYVDDKMDSLEDDDGFKSAVRDVVSEMNFEITVARY